MRIIVVLAAAVLAAGAALWFWPIGGAGPAIALQGDVARGGYLARAGGCVACHTNWTGRGAPLAGGSPIKTRFGTFVPPNLTTDPVHGIGGWTLDQFAAAVRRGVAPDGHPYYPAFPTAFYAGLSDQDVADLWAAFQTVPPVAEPAPDSAVPFPFSVRPGLKLWRGLYRQEPDLAPDPDRSAEWNRGKWLVEGVAHCAACHTGRNVLGGLQADQRFAGATDLPDGGKAPPITADALLAEGWDKDGLAYALETGIMPDGDAFGGGMAEVVAQGTAFLTPGDRAAVAAYLLEP